MAKQIKTGWVTITQLEVSSSDIAMAHEPTSAAKAHTHIIRIFVKATITYRFLHFLPHNNT